MKKVSRFFPILMILLASAVIFTSCKKDEEDENMGTNDMKSIAAIASGDPNLTILVDALSKAGLVSTLDGEGTFTVFAPTNAAFEELFQALGVSGIDDLSAETLTPILLYHVVGSTAKSTDLSTGYFESLSADTEDGKGMVLFIEVDGGVMINNDVMVSAADIEASNGVVHVVDKVILPPTVVDIAIQNSDFSILVEAVVKAGLVDALKADGPFTVMAPNNAAFEKLFMDLGIGGVEDLTAAQLTPILLYHVIPGNVLHTELTPGMVNTLNENASLEFTIEDSSFKINGSTSIIALDLQAANGVVHAIDEVLLPPAN